MRVEQLAKNIWKLTDLGGLCSNVYLVDYDVPTLIDLGAEEYNDMLVKGLKSIGYAPEQIKRVIFTHLHFDHMGKPSAFPNAEFFASKQEIEDEGMNRGFFQSLGIKHPEARLKPIGKLSWGEIIPTEGHTRGSICLWMKKEGILFSGDTLFNHGHIGRTDLPTSVPEKMDASLEKLSKLKYRILCPGHGS